MPQNLIALCLDISTSAENLIQMLCSTRFRLCRLKSLTAFSIPRSILPSQNYQARNADAHFLGHHKIELESFRK